MTISTFNGRYAFLSNYYDSPIEINGYTYPTVEHYFQAMKTVIPEGRKEITAASTPSKAKYLGRNVQLREDWEEIKEDVMLEALRAKFSDPYLRELLLSTGDAWLTEGTTWHDRYWGVCTCDRCNGAGRNRLGQLLMQVREEIKCQKS